MPIRKNIGNASNKFAADSRRQFHKLRGALHDARETFSHLRRMSGVVRIRELRGRTPVERSESFSDFEKIALRGFGRFLSGEISDDLLGGSRSSTTNFYRSASQTAARLLDEAIRGQRNR